MSFWDRLFGRKPSRPLGIKDCRDCYFFREESGYYGYCRASGSKIIGNIAPMCPDYGTSASELRQIDVLDRLKDYRYIASDDLLKSHDAEDLITSITMSKRKTIPFNPKGSLATLHKFRIKFDMKQYDTAGWDCYGQIYKNGVAVGTIRANDTLDYITYSEDIDDWEVNDTIELWAAIQDINHRGKIRNFRVYATVLEMSYEPQW